MMIVFLLIRVVGVQNKPSLIRAINGLKGFLTSYDIDCGIFKLYNIGTMSDEVLFLGCSVEA